MEPTYYNDGAMEPPIQPESGSGLSTLIYSIGVTALSAFLLKKRIQTGDATLSKVFNFLGFPRGVKLSEAATATGKDIRKVALGPIDIVDTLRNTEEIATRTGIGSTPAFTQEVVGLINKEQAAAVGRTGYFREGLERVTFEKVLDQEEIFKKVLGEEQFGVIKRARDSGLVQNTQFLDKDIYINQATNELLDFRKRNIFSKVVPTEVEGGQQAFRRVGRFDIFGQAPVFADVMGVNKGVAMLRPGESGRPRVFIGGNVFEYSRDKLGNVQQVLVEENRVLRRAGGPLEMIYASRRGEVERALPDKINIAGMEIDRTSNLGKTINFLEDTLGIGPSYGTRATLLERLVINPIRRFRALQKGEAEIIKHEYRREIQTNKVLDAAFGGEIPELLVKGGGAKKLEGAGVVSIKELSPLKRISVLFDAAENLSVVKKSAVNRVNQGVSTGFKNEDLVVPNKRGASFIKGGKIKQGSSFSKLTDIERSTVTEAGSLSDEMRYAYYDVPATEIRGRKTGLVQGLKDFVPYSFYRLNNLFSESLLGFGMKADHRLLPLMARTALIPFAYETGRQLLNYGDYLVEKFTGISPMKTVASMYAGARVAQQAVREYTGIRFLSDIAETYFPGSINSDGAVLARSIVAPLAVASKFLGKGNFSGALAGAFATYFAIGGPEPNQETTDLIREYQGDKKVPVRKGRLWGLGYLPFFGGKPERYDYSWYAKMSSDYKMKSMYGSEQEYWSYHANVFGVPLPTPSNIFGLLNIVNPYRLESKQYYDRPYEQTGSDLQSFPIFGPILSATVGKMLKPTFYRQPEKLPMMEAGLAERGLTPAHARMLGIPSLNATSYQAEDPESITNLVARQANIASEPVGIYKFVLEFFGLKIKPDLGAEKATSAMMTDPGRFFYDLNLGGMLGQTEMLRRFIMSDYSSDYRRAAAINGIKNNMPSWLPGTYSESKRDQSYFIDFTSGDPFVKIEDGEARLPGPGYEALNELYSQEEGVYSDVDKFLILADVAPYSAAYKKYEKKVLSMDLEEKWKRKVDEAIANRREVIGVDTRYKRYEEDIIAMNMGSFAKAIYEPIRKAYDFLTHDVLAEIPVIGSKLFPFRSPYEQYRKMYVEGSEYASWDRPYEDIVRPALYDVALEDPLTAAGKGAALAFLATGPMKWFNPLRTAPAAPVMFGASQEAMKYAAGAGAGLSLMRIITGNEQDMIPFHIRRDEAAIDYMDKIAYIKGRMLEDAGAGPRFADKTMVGAKTVVSYKAAMPRSADRRYFDYLLSIKEQGLSEDMIQGLPSYMSEGLSRAISDSFPTRMESDSEALEFVNTNIIPSSNWMGWNPEVSPAATKLKFIKDGINGVSENIHRFGFFESHEIDLNTRLREFSEQQIEYVASPMYSDFDAFIQNHNTKVSNGRYKVRRFSTPYGARRDIDFVQNRDKESFDQLSRVLR